MKWMKFFCSAVFAVLLPLQCSAAELIPLGTLVGLQLRDDTVTVAAFDDVLGADAREAGLKIGDQILEVNDVEVEDAADVLEALGDAGQAELKILRGSREKTLSLPLHQTQEGPRLGIRLRQGIAGIGTVTFLDPQTGAFGCLGHGVNDSGGTILRLRSGSAWNAQVDRVVKGKSGSPGQLRGAADPVSLFGVLTRNTPQGVFGRTEYLSDIPAVQTAAYAEIQTGPASIRSTVRGNTPREYSVEILKIYPQDRTDGRNFLIKVTDEQLLEITGGIVQGMSGSPIIQNGKLVGAVTHVLVNDPTTGYGIFIENMLDAAA